MDQISLVSCILVMYITSFSQLQDWKSQILLGSAYRSLTNKTKVLANTPYGACKHTIWCLQMHPYTYIWKRVEYFLAHLSSDQQWICISFEACLDCMEQNPCKCKLFLSICFICHMHHIHNNMQHKLWTNFLKKNSHVSYGIQNSKSKAQQQGVTLMVEAEKPSSRWPCPTDLHDDSSLFLMCGNLTNSVGMPPLLWLKPHTYFC